MESGYSMKAVGRVIITTLIARAKSPAIAIDNEGKKKRLTLDVSQIPI